MLREAPETGTTVLVAARVNDLPGMFDPWARYLMSLRRVVLLQPTVDDAFLFGVKLPVIPPPMVPGRGLVIERSRVTVVQSGDHRTREEPMSERDMVAALQVADRPSRRQLDQPAFAPPAPVGRRARPGRA